VTYHLYFLQIIYHIFWENTITLVSSINEYSFQFTVKYKINNIISCKYNDEISIEAKYSI